MILKEQTHDGTSALDQAEDDVQRQQCPVPLLCLTLQYSQLLLTVSSACRAVFKEEFELLINEPRFVSLISF
jgi:hypothetical protein